MVVFVYGVSKYDFEATDGSKKQISGCKVSFLQPADEDNKHRAGMVGMTFNSSNVKLFDSFTEVGFYDCDFTLVPGKMGQPTTAIKGMRFIRSVDM